MTHGFESSLSDGYVSNPEAFGFRAEGARSPNVSCQLDARGLGLMRCKVPL